MSFPVLQNSDMPCQVEEQECRNWKVSEEEARKGSRRSRVSEARAAIAYRRKEELGISVTDIARYLGVNTSSINRTLARFDESIEK
jgi:transposase-like protein